VRARPADIVDVFVYVVVLNLAIEYVPSVISESFTLSLLTAILLKVALEVVIALKNRVIKRFHAATTRRGRIAAALSLWVAAAGSKLVVLELVALVFRDAVSLGGFISVTLLVVTLLLARAAVRRLLYGTAAAD
jgi:type IV secretory pathway VirB3-like protein